MTSISICYHRSEEIGICHASSIRFWGGKTLFTLFAIVKELGIKELLHLVRDSVLYLIRLNWLFAEVVRYHRVISKIGRWFVG